MKRLKRSKGENPNLNDLLLMPEDEWKSGYLQLCFKLLCNSASPLGLRLENRDNVILIISFQLSRMSSICVLNEYLLNK